MCHCLLQGLDPASRRNLWDVVKGNKRDRAIVLTTHSMEEAEMLCDRLGIFVDGRLVCIGNPKEITSRYGGFLVSSGHLHTCIRIHSPLVRSCLSYASYFVVACSMGVLVQATCLGLCSRSMSCFTTVNQHMASDVALVTCDRAAGVAC